MTDKSPFQLRASGPLKRGGRRYPRAFAPLKWQLLVRRLEAVKALLAIRRTRLTP